MPTPLVISRHGVGKVATGGHRSGGALGVAQALNQSRLHNFIHTNSSYF
jgi:hypothetical protein